MNRISLWTKIIGRTEEMQVKNLNQNSSDDFSIQKENQKTDKKSRLMRRIKRRLRHFVQDLIALFVVIAITGVVGSAILSHIHTADGQSFYDVLATTIKKEMDDPENNGAADTAIAAVQSSVTALNNAYSHTDPTNPTLPSTASADQPENVASSDKLEKSPNQRQEYNSEEDGTGSAPVVNTQAVSSYGTFDDGYAMTVLELVNAERAKEGLAPLAWNNGAAAAAKARADEIVVQMSHTRPNGASGITALHDFGINWNRAGENLASGQASPEEVVTSWMNSEVHRANIMKPAYTSLGVACLYVPNSTYGYYWVQLFVG